MTVKGPSDHSVHFLTEQEFYPLWLIRQMLLKLSFWQMHTTFRRHQSKGNHPDTLHTSALLVYFQEGIIIPILQMRENIQKRNMLAYPHCLLENDGTRLGPLVSPTLKVWVLSTSCNPFSKDVGTVKLSLQLKSATFQWSPRTLS